MNKDEFFQYVQSSRDCETALLDQAVRKGIQKAENEKLDIRKLLRLAAACAACAVLCFSLNTEPVKAGVEGYKQNKMLLMQDSNEVLNGYKNDMFDYIINNWGVR